MYVDPVVVRRKVERELAEYVERIDHFRARGIWVLEYRFPQLLVAMVAPNIKPYPVVPYGLLLDLANYDVEPPSVQFVNPLTRELLTRAAIPTSLPRQRPDGNVDALLQAWSPEDAAPFVCLRGVREYHNNPGHTEDHWLLHRASGAGRIVRLLDLLSRHGTETMAALEMALQIQPTGQFQVKMPLPI